MWERGQTRCHTCAHGYDDVEERLRLNWVTGMRDVPGNSVDRFDGIGHARNSLSYYHSAGFRHTWSEWPDDGHDSITEQFGRYVGRVLDDAASEKTYSEVVRLRLLNCDLCVDVAGRAKL